MSHARNALPRLWQLCRVAQLYPKSALRPNRSARLRRNDFDRWRSAPLQIPPINLMGELKNKRALVTGGGQGLGEAIVRHLIEAGADVAIHYFSSESGALALKTHAQHLGRRAEAFKADLTKESEAAALVEKSVKFL